MQWRYKKLLFISFSYTFHFPIYYYIRTHCTYSIFNNVPLFWVQSIQILKNDLKQECGRTNLTVVLREKWQTLEIEKKWKKFPCNFFIIWLHFCYCFGLNFNIQLKNLVVSQNFMVLYTILISSSLIYIHVNSYFIITFSVVWRYEYLTRT